MALTFGDRVQETFTTTGTGTISLGGAVVGYQAFSAVMANAGTCYYAATDGVNWEVGLGTYATSGNTLARTTILSSSNSGSAVSWSAGTKNIWLDFPATAALVPDGTTITKTGNVISVVPPALTVGYNSGQQTYTPGGSLTLAHSLGKVPTILQIKAHCLTAEGGYSIGDEVWVNPNLNDQNQGWGGFSVVPDATNLNVRYGASGNNFEIIRKDTGGVIRVTAANWALIFIAYA